VDLYRNPGGNNEVDLQQCVTSQPRGRVEDKAIDVQAVGWHVNYGVEAQCLT
jgi:hypothetical protein